MNTLNDLIYAYEIASVDELSDLYYRDILTQKDIIRISRYFVNNIPRNHKINGNVWMTVCGIIHWYDEHNNSMTDAQAIYLVANVKNNIHERALDLY